MATQTGSKVIFGFTGTDGIAATPFTGKMLLQSADFAPGSDEVQIKNSVGDLTTRVFSNAHKKATIECVATGADVAAARTNQSALLALYHTVISITACADMPELVDTTPNWFVVDAKVTGSNDNVSRVTLTLENHDNITASAA